jgi:hypothetical protein
MRRHYRIVPRNHPPDEDIARLRDARRLMFNYHRALRLVHRRPIYRDPKAFLALLLIVLLAWLLSESARQEREEAEQRDHIEQVAP